jgi:hypothetical protein
LNPKEDDFARTARQLFEFYPADELGARARSAMREALERPDPELCVVLKSAESGDVMVCVGGRIISEFNLNALRHTMVPNHFMIVETLLTTLLSQSEAATLAGVIANAELALQRKRMEGAIKGGKATTKATRKKVEQRMRAEILKGSDPKAYFAAWSEEYGYSIRSLRNILEDVAGTP